MTVWEKHLFPKKDSKGATVKALGHELSFLVLPLCSSLIDWTNFQLKRMGKPHFSYWTAIRPTCKQSKVLLDILYVGSQSNFGHFSRVAFCFMRLQRVRNAQFLTPARSLKSTDDYKNVKGVKNITN